MKERFSFEDFKDEIKGESKENILNKAEKEINRISKLPDKNKNGSKDYFNALLGLLNFLKWKNKPAMGRGYYKDYEDICNDLIERGELDESFLNILKG